jgi:hypothetical protein
LQLLALPPAWRPACFRSTRQVQADDAGGKPVDLYFQQHVIQHRFCGTCGVAPFGEGVLPNGDAMASINLRCIPAIDLGTLDVVPYDGQSR